MLVVSLLSINNNSCWGVLICMTQGIPFIQLTPIHFNSVYILEGIPFVVIIHANSSVC